MNRLTFKDKNEYCFNDFNKDSERILNKLGQLEDIEEEIGIDLITLFKALKKGYYKKLSNDVVVYVKSKDTRFQEDISNFIKSYGKTWALTREELENEMS